MHAPTSAWTAVIPLRAGSQGLPGKNVRELAGRPLYRHSVDQALAAGATRVLITTDIPEVLRAALPAGVACLERPPALAGHAVPMDPVLVHALQAGAVAGPVVLLQATSPLRAPADIRAALAVFARGDHELVMSVTDADRGVLKWGRVDGDRFVPLSEPAHCFANRQSLPPVVRPNGAVYVFDAAAFLARGTLACERIGMVLMPPERSHDIDTLHDFERASALLTRNSA
jgi:N-acylneuraminate cytidylyltransferase